MHDLVGSQEMIRRVGIVGLSVSILAISASTALATECAPRPEKSTSYAVTAIRADQSEPPQTTPPVAVLDTGVAAVPELAGRLRTGANELNGTQDTADTDGHGT